MILVEINKKVLVLILKKMELKIKKIIQIFEYSPQQHTHSQMVQNIFTGCKDGSKPKISFVKIN